MDIEHENLIESGYAYLQGGTPPINIYQDIRVDNKKMNQSSSWINGLK